MSQTRLLTCFALLFWGLLTACSPTHRVARADAAQRVPNPQQQIALLIRTADAGMSHSVNTGIERLIERGLPVSVSVMFPTPWYQVATSASSRIGS